MKKKKKFPSTKKKTNNILEQKKEDKIMRVYDTLPTPTSFNWRKIRKEGSYVSRSDPGKPKLKAAFLSPNTALVFLCPPSTLLKFQSNPLTPLHVRNLHSINTHRFLFYIH